MKKYIKIESLGEIDPKSFTLIGASTKRGDEEKIGFFGSGLKYAMAVLLRQRVDFFIFSGVKKIEVETKSEEFRGQTFNQIYIDGEKTSMTMEMGIDWKPWYCIREIFCNAIDEGEHKISVIDENDLVPESNKTTFFIEFTRNFKFLIDNWNLYFTQDRQDLVDSWEGSKIYFGGDEEIIYRRGVQCYFSKKEYDFQEVKQSIYHYDIDWAEINESRELVGTYSVYSRLSEEMAKNARPEMVRTLLDKLESSENYLEARFYWNSVNFFNDIWLDAIGNRILVPRMMAGYFMKGARENYLILPFGIINSLQNILKTKSRSLDFLRQTMDMLLLGKLSRHIKNYWTKALSS